MSKKSTRALASATLMSLVLTTALSTTPVKAAVGSVTRTSGVDRYSTAASVATSNWTTSDDVVLVSGEGYADAVSASALAKKLNAPILLTTAGSLNSDAQKALTTLKAKNIYVVGGDASVKASVRTELKKTYTLTELGGANRYETNAAVAQKLVDLGVKADEVIMVGGEGFSDALSVAPIAAAKGQILLLGMNNADYMKPVLDFVNKNKSKVTVVGTKNVINDAIYSAANAVKRVDGGQDRFDTNMKVLAEFKDTVKMDKMFVANATGEGYADALVASAVAGKTGAPLVLVDTESSNQTATAIKYIKANADKTKTDLNVVGGTGVVSEGTVNAINTAIGNPNPGPATVQSIEAVNLNEIKIHFNSAIDSDTAEDVTNYKIDGVQLTAVDANGVSTGPNSAVAKAIDDNTVTIVFAKKRNQDDKVSVSVKKQIYTMDRSNMIDAFEQPDVVFKDTQAPTIKKVTVEGNSQLTVEFSEAVNMQTIDSLKNKFKIDGQSLGNVNTTYSKIKNKIVVPDESKGTVGTWAYKVMFYFDSEIGAGSHTLKISDGDTNGVLCDAAQWIFKEAEQSFSVDTMTTQPQVKSIKEVKNGEVHVTFDRPMDVQTALDPSNWEINDKNLYKDLKFTTDNNFDTDDNDCTIKITGLSDSIDTGSNRIYIKNTIKDAYGNKVPDDTRKTFDDIQDNTKPTVLNVSVADSETINVRFSKPVKYEYAKSLTNYKLLDNKGVDITDHIEKIVSYKNDTDTSDVDTYKIKMKRANPDNSSDDWRLNGTNYSLTIKNITDTSSSQNAMDEVTKTISGIDDVSPEGSGIFVKPRAKNSSNKDQVVIYFSEPMDTATLTNKANYTYTNGKGDTNKSLPSDATVNTGGDQKSAIIEFPSSYNVIKTVGDKLTFTTNENDVLAVNVANVKDQAGNKLAGTAFNNANTIREAKVGAKVKANTMKTYYVGDDLKVDVQFDKSLDQFKAEDFTLGGVTPSSMNKDGDIARLIFKDGALATAADKTNAPAITYANGKTNTNPTKIDLVKAQGLNAKLAINATGTTDETGALISRNEDGSNAALSATQARVYNYNAAPRTTCFDNHDKNSDFWTATKDATGGKVYITFDTVLDAGSGLKLDDFTFSANGTDIKADSIDMKGNTVVFNFDNNNVNYTKAFSDTINVKVNNSFTSSLRTVRDGAGDSNNYYVPTDDDKKPRSIDVKDGSVAVTGVSLDKNTLSLAPTASQTLVATVTPANAATATWTSSDNTVATVDATGKVTAVKVGTATITATAGTQKATCVVTVAAAGTTVDWIVKPSFKTITTTIKGTVDATKVTAVKATVDGVDMGAITINADGTFSIDVNSVDLGKTVVVKAYDANSKEVNSIEVIKSI